MGKEQARLARAGRGARKAPVLLALSGLLAAVFVLSFSLGRYGVPIGEVPRVLLSRVFPIKQTWTPQLQAVVLNIRLPRILTACMVGCSLSAAGAAYQGVFQNPMASPDILGASSGAAFGAALAIWLGASSRVITLAAFIGGMATVGAVFLLARRAPGRRVMNRVLACMVVCSLFTAGTSYIKLVADPSNQLPAITYWLMGSLSGVKGKDAAFAALPMALGLIPLLLLRWRLNLLTQGDEEARALGVNTGALRLIVIACATLVPAASISVAGLIGGGGLVIPHMCRKGVGGDYRALLPASCLAGAAFLLAVDDVSRSLLAVEIPIGILTALIGAPFFLYLLCRGDQAL